MDKPRPTRIDPELAETGQWGLDPRDVKFHARRMREAKAVGPRGKLFRVAVGILVLVGVFFVVWNFETLSSLRFDFSAFTSAFSRDTAQNPAATVSDDGTGALTGRNPIAGVSLPTSLPGEEPEAETGAASVDNPAAAPPAATVATAPPSGAAEPRPETATALPTVTAETPPARAAPPEPEPPPGPETFGFGSSAVNVSEGDASAAVLVLRDGDRRRASSISWWTTDGTAKSGADFANLGRRVERFGASEQNRAIRVPIIGDRNVEGPETFYIHIAPGDSAETLARIEVVIVDDD